MKKILLLFFILFQISLFAQISDLNNCAGNNVFDLTSQEAILIGSQNPADLIITYHVSLADAQNNVNAIANPTSYTSVSSAETIYVRVENTNTISVVYETLNLIINSEIDIIYEVLYSCSDANVFVYGAGGGGYFSYEVNDPTFDGSVNDNVIYTLSPASFEVIATDQFGCQGSVIVVVYPSPPLSLIATVNGNSVTLSVYGGAGNFQFSADGGTTFQSNNVFSNLAPGDYCFIVRDLTLNCIAQQCVTIPAIPDLQVNGTYQDYNNDGFVNVGDAIMYDFSVTNNGTLDMTNLTLNAFGLSTNGANLAVLPGGATDTATFTATYVFTQEDINAGFVTRNFQINGAYNGNSTSNTATNTTYLSITDGIKLNAFLDSNGNNIQDNGEPNINVGSFEYQINNGNTTHVESSNGIYYLYETNTSNTYNLSYTLDAAYQNFTVTQNNYTNITVPVNSGVTTYNFPILGDYSPDLQVYLNQYGAPPRPGFDYLERIMYRNSGNTVLNGTITFTKDAIVSITNVSEPGFVTNANGFSYNFTNLLPNETRYIYVTMQTPTIPTVALGDVITNSVTITLPAGDVAPNNNEATLSQVVVGSYDPNDKTEVHGGKIVYADFTSSNYLTYTIQFENTGTANAINVKVDDVLDAMLDVATLKMIDASHDYVLIKEGNNLSWKFDGIDLPPSVANTTTGKGYIVFQIKPMSGYAIGDIIPNTAEIYFDFNPAIVTNTFTTEFVETLGVSDFKKNDFVVYPNPATNELFIHSKANEAIDAVVLVDVLGKTIYQEVVKATFSRIDISSFQKGIYFLKVTHNGYEETIKVIKQ